MSCLQTTVPTIESTSLRFADKLLFPVEVRKSTKGNLCCCIPEAGCAVTAETVGDLLQTAHDIIVDYLEDLQADKLPFPVPLHKSPSKDENFVSMEVVEVLLSKLIVSHI